MKERYGTGSHRQLLLIDGVSAPSILPISGVNLWEVAARVGIHSVSSLYFRETTPA